MLSPRACGSGTMASSHPSRKGRRMASECPRLGWLIRHDSIARSKTECRTTTRTAPGGLLDHLNVTYNDTSRGGAMRMEMPGSLPMTALGVPNLRDSTFGGEVRQTATEPAGLELNSFRSAGLKYHDSIVRTRRKVAGMNSPPGSPDAKCENNAPVSRKKTPA